MYKLLLFPIFFCSWNLISFVACEYNYTARLQPEYDVINVDSYLKNERLFNLQMQCVLFDGPCDAVGRWLKPRVPAALLGTCIMCTPKQEINMNKIIEYIQETRPDLYRAGVAKYLQKSGLSISEDDTKNVEKLDSTTTNYFSE